MLISRFGGDLLSHVLRRSTIGATALNGRVRDGIGCFARAMTTKPRNELASYEATSVGRDFVLHHCSKSLLRSMRCAVVVCY
jgi:hypothetical protein